MNATARALSTYQSESVMSASPAELIIMLYDALIKNMKLSKLFLEEQDLQKANTHLKKSQDILDELIRGLDLKYSLAGELFSLYEYMVDTLVKANIQKSPDLLPPLIEMATTLREAWQSIKHTTGKVVTIEED